MTTIRILLADDQEGIRAAFRLILDAQPDMTVIAEAADGVTALELARHLRPDIVLADVRMPGLDGLHLARELAGPGVADPIRVIVVTTFDLDEYVHAALRHGASGFMLKRSGPTLMIEAIRAAMAGDTLISPQVTMRLLRHLNAKAAIAPEQPDAAMLTGRERDVARLVATGRSNAEIAAELHISVGTVKGHLTGIHARLGTRNRVEIAVWAHESGLTGRA
ncbi:response regulator transcription factor [Micromonospora sp. NPDC049204]|uniref:response regulator transcription factor n=1 Tax=unclassified Micromonospora TaxID=2617518 RepID=UPI00340F241D